MRSVPRARGLEDTLYLNEHWEEFSGQPFFTASNRYHGFSLLHRLSKTISNHKSQYCINFSSRVQSNSNLMRNWMEKASDGHHLYVLNTDRNQTPYEYPRWYPCSTYNKTRVIQIKSKPLHINKGQRPGPPHPER